MNPTRVLAFDTLVVGGGIAGLQSALDMADQGFQVAIVDKDASIGGKMIRLLVELKKLNVPFRCCAVGVRITHCLWVKRA